MIREYDQYRQHVSKNPVRVNLTSPEVHNLRPWARAQSRDEIKRYRQLYARGGEFSATDQGISA
jgi:hypothetical protein